MEDNTDEEHIDNPTNPQSGDPSDENIPAKDTETIAAIQETENMEVHHHAHRSHGKKTWKHYFWEFLMLFFAVFCGSLAEYQLEHKVENDRGQELAKFFYEELKNDSVSVAEKYYKRIEQENALQYLMDDFTNNNIADPEKKFAINFHKGFLLRRRTLFDARTSVLSQLKNSGSLRYFKNNDLQKLIGDISVTIQDLKDRQAFKTTFRENYITPFLIKHYDTRFELAIRKFGGSDLAENLLRYERSDTIIPFSLHKLETFDAGEATNILGLFSINSRGSRTIQFEKYIEQNTELLKLLRNEYHLE